MRHVNFSKIGKEQFHTTGAARLRAVAKALGLAPGEFSVRSIRGGPAVRGEVILHTDKVYVQLCNGWSHDAKLLVRTCQGRRDFTGGPNQWITADWLNDPTVAAVEIARRCLL